MKKVLLTVLMVIVFAGTAAGAFYFGKRSTETSPTSSETAEISPTQTQEPTPTQAVSATSGIITGSLSYPSEGIPDDLEVCAENTLTESQFCTSEKLESDKFTYKLGYELEVPVGSYLVYAKTKFDTYKAYFSEFVTCGLEVSCKSHEPIVISVSAGQTIENIDPGDWYAPTSTPSPSPSPSIVP